MASDDPRGFVLAQINIDDPETFAEYQQAGHHELLARFGGTVVVGEPAPDVLEGTWPAQLTIMIEFPTRAQAKAWYESSDYQRMAKLRQAATHTNMVLLSGLVAP